MITTPITKDLVHGAAELEKTDLGWRPHRLPGWVLRQYSDDQLSSKEVQPAGVRIAVRTVATRLELVTHSTYLTYRGVERPRGIIDVYVDGVLVKREKLTGGKNLEADLQTGQMQVQDGPSHVLSLGGLAPGEKIIEMWLPHNEELELIDLRSDEEVHPDTRTRTRWVHHGSSISQGSNALAPSETWPAIVARETDADLTNLGVGGSSFVDQFMARVIRDTPADVISLNFGINVVNLDGMRLRVFVPAVHGFLDTVRDGHPDTPIVVASPLYCGIHENTPGPGGFDPATFTTGQASFIAEGTEGDTALGRLTLQVIRTALREIVEQRHSTDPNIFFLEGTELYGARDAEELPLTDNLHPSPQAHRLIGQRAIDYVRSDSRLAAACFPRSEG